MNLSFNKLYALFSRFQYRLSHSDIGRRMVSGAVWSLTGTALAKFIVLCSSVLCAHILSKQEYGEFGLIRSTINMFVVFGAAGMGVTATKYIAEYRKTSSEKVASIYYFTNGFALFTGIIITVIVLLVAPYLSENLFDSTRLTPSIRVGAILLFLSVLNGAQNGTLLGLEKFKNIAINIFWGSVAESLFMLIGAYYFGVFGAVLGYGMGYVVLFFLNHLIIRNELKALGVLCRSSSINKSDLNILFKFSLPAAVSSLMTAPTYWAIKSILVNNSGFEELANYEAAEQWRTIILFVPSAVSQIILPILSSISSNSNKKFWKVLKLNLLINAGTALGICLVVSTFSSIIMGFYGENYADGQLVLIVLAASTIFSSTASVVGISLTSRAKTWIGLLFNFIWACMMILFSSIFIEKYGALGVSLAIFFSYLLHTTFQLIFLKCTFRYSTK